ncbi:hypothetical protein ACHAXT_001406 [Thalassiosira profunda]
MLSLNADQTADLPFPVGCPVWYNGAAGNPDDLVQQPLLKRGVVQAVSFDIATKSMLYSIGASLGGGVTDDVPEGRLAFGASCPVSVTFEGEKAEGTILLSGPSGEDPGKIVYTVMLSADGNCTLAEGIDGDMVSYRKEVVASEETLMATAFAGGSIEKKASQPKTEANNRVTPSPKLPASITCNATKREDGKRDDLSMKKKRAREDSDSFSKESTLATSESKEGIRMVMHIPPWLQADLRASRNLFYHLIGSKRDGRKGVADIGKESKNCRIYVKYDPKSKVDHPMSIHFLANSRTSAVRDLHDLREAVQTLLVQFIGPFDPGCAGRLLYEVARSCWGPHRPEGSRSRAVCVRDPIARGYDVMSLVELPSIRYSDGKVAHHASFLDKYAAQLDEHDCFVEICAKKFTPVTFCDPYALVRGKTWQDVDLAVDIVNRAIWDHVAYCDCYIA